MCGEIILVETKAAGICSQRIYVFGSYKCLKGFDTKIKKQFPQVTLIENKAFPSNGVIFVEDHLWVDGKISYLDYTIFTKNF